MAVHMTDYMLIVGSRTSISAKQQRMAKTKESVINGMKDLSIIEPAKIKNKNLNVLAEYRKVKRKDAANFVVIGKYLVSFKIRSANQIYRPCGCRKKHSDGSSVVRSESDR